MSHRQRINEAGYRIMPPVTEVAIRESVEQIGSAAVTALANSTGEDSLAPALLCGYVRSGKV